MNSIEEIIRNAESYDLSAKDIEDICENKVKITAYSELVNVNSLDEIFSPEGNAIILYQTKQNFGHWVALLKNETHIEFFDSYGFKMDEELSFATYNNTPYLTNLFKKSGEQLIYNDVRLQKFAHEINTCGRWTSLRVVLRDYPLNDFIDMFKSNGSAYDGDFWVSSLTIIHSLKNKM